MDSARIVSGIILGDAINPELTEELATIVHWSVGNSRVILLDAVRPNGPAEEQRTICIIRVLAQTGEVESAASIEVKWIW